jgi:condensin complex subunit 2
MTTNSKATSRRPSYRRPSKKDDNSSESEDSLDSLKSNENDAYPNLPPTTAPSTLGRVAPPRPSNVRLRPSLCGRASLNGTSARRRSSSRFLLAHSQSQQQQQALQEMYQHALRLHAENRITASNSWQLPLIDSLASIPESSQSNFAQASCTIDASVKIYSYRVDDVHLTSYKVLANLHRNDTTSGNKDTGESSVEDGFHNSEDASKVRNYGNRSVHAGPTLESNPGM